MCDIIYPKVKGQKVAKFEIWTGLLSGKFGLWSISVASNLIENKGFIRGKEIV